MLTLTAALLLLLLPAQEPGPEAGLRSFFDDLRLAFDSRDGSKIADRFDAPRFFTAMRSWGDPPARTPEERARAIQNARGALAHKLSEEAGIYTFARIEILRTELEDDGRRARVLTRDVNRFDRVARRRWWLAREADGPWRAVDTEDTGRGIRLSLELAMAMPGLVAKAGSAAAKVLPALDEVESGIALAALGELTGVAGTLEGLPAEGVPPRLAGIRDMLAAAALRMAMGRDEAALPLLGTALEAHPDLPFLHFLLAVARNRLGRHEAALGPASRYLETGGGDPDGRREVGIALSALGRREEALAAFRKALDEDPDSPTTLVLLAGALGPEEMGEIAKRFAKLDDPAYEFEDMVVALIRGEKAVAAGALVAALRKLDPEDPNADYYGARLLADEGEYVKAGALLLRALPRIEDPDESYAFEEAYLDCMIAAGKPVEALAALPGSTLAFGYLADELAHAEDGEKLLALSAARLNTSPGETGVLVYRGYALELLGRRAEAETDYAKGMADAADPGLRERLRRARVFNRYAMDLGLIAWEEIPPRRETFLQLAELYADDRDAVGLAALIAAHRKADPEDPAISLFAAETLWIAGDHATMLDLLIAKREAILADARSRFRYEDRLIQGMVRLGKLDDALKAAADTGDPWYPAIVHAARGDVEATAKALAICVEKGYAPATFYRDKDLGKALRTDPMAPLRARYPPPE